MIKSYLEIRPYTKAADNVPWQRLWYLEIHRRWRSSRRPGAWPFSLLLSEISSLASESFYSCNSTSREIEACRIFPVRWCFGPRSVAGHVPTLPWIRSRVWARVGWESGQASGEGWVGTWPVNRLDPLFSRHLESHLLWKLPVTPLGSDWLNTVIVMTLLETRFALESRSLTSASSSTIISSGQEQHANFEVRQLYYFVRTRFNYNYCGGVIVAAIELKQRMELAVGKIRLRQTLSRHSKVDQSFKPFHSQEWSIGHYQNEWVGISNAKALGIVWRDRTSKNSKQKCRTTTLVAVCAARYTSIILPRHFCLLAWLIDWILSLQTVLSAIAAVVRTHLPARFGNGQSQMPPAASPGILHHTGVKNLAFHSLLRWKMIILPILASSLNTISLSKVGRMYFFCGWAKSQSNREKMQVQCSNGHRDFESGLLHKMTQGSFQSSSSRSLNGQ